MLMGQYEHSIDPKNRINFPAKFREQLGENFILTVGLDECIAVYSAEEWDKLVEKIGTLPSTKSSAVKRFLYDGAFSVDFDSQGRILIPPVLREYANLEGEVHIIGMDTNLEIWNTELWNEENAQYTPESVAAIMEELNF